MHKTVSMVFKANNPAQRVYYCPAPCQSQALNPSVCSEWLLYYSWQSFPASFNAIYFQSSLCVFAWGYFCSLSRKHSLWKQLWDVAIEVENL